MSTLTMIDWLLFSVNRAVFLLYSFMTYDESKHTINKTCMVIHFYVLVVA